MIERSRSQPLDLNLCNGSVTCGCAGAGDRDLSLHERNHLRNRPMMRGPDHRRHPSVGDRPQHAR